MNSLQRSPLRGEIWFVQFHVDPPGKGRRPVVVVSIDGRNRHERADTVLVIPLSTSIHKESPTHVLLSAGETGLPWDSIAQAENIAVVRKQNLIEPRGKLRQISDTRICQMAEKVALAMGCVW